MKDLDKERAARESAAVCRALLAHPAVREGTHLAFYMPMEGREVDVLPAVDVLHSQRKRVYVPRIVDGSMSFVALPPSALTSLIPHPDHGFLQPAAEAGESTEETLRALDVVVVPGRAFDRRVKAAVK